ncbi:MAG: hypothetical protein Q8J74_07575 [Candidatus Didemnitutus sp.]|nr:hypothetical protein [Candidatus Didemnitutus sp.]
MTQESVTYLTNIGISVVLAGMLTHSWASQGRSVPMRFWMMAAWVMVVTNCLFAARPLLPFWVGRLFPTLLVTVAHVGILYGARATAGRSILWRVLIGATVAHGVVLVFFILLGEPSYWRMVCNGLVWASLSVAAFVVFRQGPAFFWKSIFSPANVLLLHAMFHVFRITLSILSGAYEWTGVAKGLQLFGDLEVSMFIVALYVSILVATLRQHYEELASARAEMQTLSGLLPICAWCKKVRDDRGYWQQVEEYFSRRSAVDFTHGICADCAEVQIMTYKDDQKPNRSG